MPCPAAEARLHWPDSPCGDIACANWRNPAAPRGRARATTGSIRSRDRISMCSICYRIGGSGRFLQEPPVRKPPSFGEGDELKHIEINRVADGAISLAFPGPVARESRRNRDIPPRHDGSQPVSVVQWTLQICVKFHPSAQPDFHTAVSERGVTIRDGIVPLCVRQLVSGPARRGGPGVWKGSNQNGQDGTRN